jgi:hypothetical protein
MSGWVMLGIIAAGFFAACLAVETIAAILWGGF